MMNNANDLARAAISMAQLANEMKPQDDDPFAQMRKLIQYHLLAAARLTRQVADSTGERANAESSDAR
jgi:hypothetical protein